MYKYGEAGKHSRAMPGLSADESARDITAASPADKSASTDTRG